MKVQDFCNTKMSNIINYSAKFHRIFREISTNFQRNV